MAFHVYETKELFYFLPLHFLLKGCRMNPSLLGNVCGFLNSAVWEVRLSTPISHNAESVVCIFFDRSRINFATHVLV
jgi:hypothetical protein